MLDIEIDPVQYAAPVIFDYQVANGDDWHQDFTVK
jgi:hypothetical protein